MCDPPDRESPGRDGTRLSGSAALSAVAGSPPEGQRAAPCWAGGLRVNSSLQLTASSHSCLYKGLGTAVPGPLCCLPLNGPDQEHRLRRFHSQGGELWSTTQTSSGRPVGRAGQLRTGRTGQAGKERVGRTHPSPTPAASFGQLQPLCPQAKADPWGAPVSETGERILHKQWGEGQATGQGSGHKVKGTCDPWITP